MNKFQLRILSAVWVAMQSGAFCQPPSGTKSLHEALARVDPAALERVIRFRGGPEASDRLERLASFVEALEVIRKGVSSGEEESLRRAQDLLGFKRRTLLENPLLASLNEVLLVRRSVTHKNLGLPANWEGNSSLPRTGWDNQILALSVRKASKKKK